MPKLSDFKTDEIKVVEPPPPPRLSDFKADQIKVIDETNAVRKALKLPNEADYPVALAIPQKFAEGATLGFADEAYGALKAGSKVFDGKEAVGKEYEKSRDEWRQTSAANTKLHPWTSGLSEAAGGMVAGGALGRVAKGLGKGTRAVIEGTLGGLGSTESKSGAGILGDAALGGGAGLVLNQASKLIPGYSSEELKNYAAEKAVKASGAMTKQFKELRNKGLIRQQGEWLLKNKVVTPFATLESIAENANIKREAAGATIGDVIDNVDSLRSKAVELGDELVAKGFANASPARKAAARKMFRDQIEKEFGYNFENVAAGIRDIAKRDERIGAAAFHRTKLDFLAEVFEGIAKKGPGSLREGLQNKTQQRRLLKDVDSLGEEYKQEIYDIISKELDRAVGNTENLAAGIARMAGDAVETGGRAGKKTATGTANMLPEGTLKLPPGGPSSTVPALAAGAVDNAPVPASAMARRGAAAEGTKGLKEESDNALGRFKAANRDYAAAATAQKTANDRLGQVMSNRDYGLTTAIATNAGMLAGGAGGAVAMGAINNFARKYGSTIQATVAYKLGTMLENQPEVFGKYGPKLREALRQGAQQFLIANEIVAKDDPQYAQFLQDVLNEANDGNAMQRRANRN